MPNIDHGDQSSGGLDGEASSEIRAFEIALREGSRRTDDPVAPGHADQLERDLADIESAAAALRRAQPALEAWSSPRTDDRTPIAIPKPRPVWLLIGLLWISTALVTVGAVAAIARLAG